MVRYGCEKCRVSCTSVPSLIQHVTGKLHRANLSQDSPEEVKQLGRLQYFLDTFIKEQPVLGLEYVQEKQVDDSYVYTCRLCNVELEWRIMVSHVMDMKHAERYINTHYKRYLRVPPNCAGNERDRLIPKVAAKIQNKYGRKEIHIAPPGFNSSSLPEAVSPKDCKKGNYDDSDKAASPPTEYKKDFNNKYPHLQRCMLCGVSCTSVLALCEHVQGKVHKKNIKITQPDEVKELGRLDYFLKNYMTDEPILGLEYLVEENLGQTYNYTCRLCNVEANLRKIVGHVMELKHVKSYITKHHAYLLPSLPKFHLKPNCKALRDAVVKIHGKLGRQEIRVKKIPAKEGDGKTKKGLKDKASYLHLSTHSGGDTSYSKRLLPYEESHDSHSSKKVFKQSTDDGPPFAKRSRNFPDDDKDASSSRQPFSKYEGYCFDEKPPQDTQRNMIIWTPMNEFEFNTNDEFLEYLANFEIDNEKDVVFIRNIIQNCARALMSFQEEAAKQKSNQDSEAALSNTRRMDRETVDVHVQEEADRKKSIYMSHTNRTLKEVPDTYLQEEELERHMSSQPKASLANKGRTDKQTQNISYRELEKERQRSSHRPDSPSASRSRAYKESSDVHFRKPVSKRHKSSHWQETSLASQSEANAETLDNSILNQRTERQKSSQPVTLLASKSDKETPGINVWEQETKRKRISPQPEPPLAFISKADREPPTELHSSVSVSNAPPPKNDITDFFFSSIKDMEESEVVSVFQKIATTNPAFQGMNIPAVIRLLKDSGRLKKS